MACGFLFAGFMNQGGDIMKSEYNKHHILYCRKTWDSGYAKKLRNHWYLQAIIPAKDLHEEIHRFLNSVPLPPPNRCVEAYKVLNDLDRKGVLDNREDTLMARISLLLSIWACHHDTKATCAALRVQKAIAEDFYKKHPCA